MNNGKSPCQKAHPLRISRRTHLKPLVAQAEVQDDLHGMPEMGLAGLDSILMLKAGIIDRARFQSRCVVSPLRMLLAAKARVDADARHNAGSSQLTFSFMFSRASAADGVVPLGELMLFPALCLTFPGVHSVCMQHMSSAGSCRQGM